MKEVLRKDGTDACFDSHEHPCGGLVRLAARTGLARRFSWKINEF